jgi:hypothetical protein
MTDVRLPDYIRFKNCVPAVSQMGDGSFRAVFTRTKNSAEDARFCIDYVTRYAINLQEKMRKNIGT